MALEKLQQHTALFPVGANEVEDYALIDVPHVFLLCSRQSKVGSSFVSSAYTTVL